MRFVRRALLTAVLTAAAAGTGYAQGTGTTGGTAGGTNGGTAAGAGGLNAATLGSTLGSTLGTGGTGGATSTTTNTGTGAGAGVIPTQATSFNTTSLLDTSIGSQITAGSLSTSNILGRYYSAMGFQGRAGATQGGNPGGFGLAMFPSTGAGAGGTGRTGAANMTGRAGATGSTFGSTNQTTGGFTNSSTTAQIIALPRQISYVAQIRFSSPSLTPLKVHTEARAAVDRSTMIGNARGVEVLGEGAVVTLRGSVATEDESRLVEGLVRLTPGVRDVKNELRFPNPQP